MNIAVLIGRLTRDPELRYIPSTGKAVANFAIAVDRPYTSKSRERMTDFFNIVVWGKQAENCQRYLQKGRNVAIQGRIQSGSYTTQDGTRKFVTEVWAERVQFIEWGEKKEDHTQPFGQFDEISFETTDEDIPF